MDNSLKVASGFILGAAIGTAIGILIAPDNGKKTRKMLSTKSDELKNDLSHLVTKSLDSFKVNYNTKVDDYTKSVHKTLDSIKDAVKVRDKVHHN